MGEQVVLPAQFGTGDEPGLPTLQGEVQPQGVEYGQQSAEPDFRGTVLDAVDKTGGHPCEIGEFLLAEIELLPSSSDDCCKLTSLEGALGDVCA